MSGKIDLERQDNGVATLWIDNPAHRNALNNSLIDALTGHYRTLAADPACRVIVVRGRGGIFCAGRELRDLRALQDAGQRHHLRDLREAPSVERGGVVLPTPDRGRDREVRLRRRRHTVELVRHRRCRGHGTVRLSRGASRLSALARPDGAVSRRRPQEGDGARPDRPAHRRRRSRPHRPDHAGRAPGRARRGSDEADRGPAAQRPRRRQAHQEFVWHSDEAGHRAAMASAVDSISLGLASPQAREASPPSSPRNNRAGPAPRGGNREQTQTADRRRRIGWRRASQPRGVWPGHLSVQAHQARGSPSRPAARPTCWAGATARSCRPCWASRS